MMPADDSSPLWPQNIHGQARQMMSNVFFSILRDSVGKYFTLKEVCIYNYDNYASLVVNFDAIYNTGVVWLEESNY